MTTSERYRGYFFGNFYLSSIQQGIQAAHVIQDMMYKYTRDYGEATYAGDIFKNWSYHDKTMILLNGGMHQDLYGLYSKLHSLTRQGKMYPVAYFQEERAALNDAITCVGIVLPESVYDLEITTVGNERIAFGAEPTDISIKELISQYKLAH